MNRTFLARLTAAVALALGFAVLSPSAPTTGAATVADSAAAALTAAPTDMGWQ